MKNVFIILLIVVSIGFMFYILFDRYQKILEEESKQKQSYNSYTEYKIEVS